MTNRTTRPDPNSDQLTAEELDQVSGGFTPVPIPRIADQAFTPVPIPRIADVTLQLLPVLPPLVKVAPRG
jgi:hypothetical protein